MARPRKLRIAQVESAAIDKRQGHTWKSLSVKYEVSINTIRKALADYRHEFTPLTRIKRSELERRLTKTKKIRLPASETRTLSFFSVDNKFTKFYTHKIY